MIIVSDTSPIANLVVVDSVDLLPQLFGTMVIPEVVYQELLANGQNHPVTQTAMTVDWLDIRSVTNQSQVTILECEHRLDPGEANAIVLAIELQATQLLIDERLGRAEARRRGLRITGILGVLIAAKRQRLIPVVRPILDRLLDEANLALLILAMKLSGGGARSAPPPLNFIAELSNAANFRISKQLYDETLTLAEEVTT